MKFILSLSIMLCAALTACHSNHSSIQKSNSSFSSMQTGKIDMPTKSPMLNEILKIKGVPPGQFKDVSDIVSRYIPIGTSREQTKQILVKMNQNVKEVGNTIQTGYLAEFIPMVPRVGISIDLKFNEFNLLEMIDAKLSYQQ